MCRQKIEIIERYLNEKEKDKEVEIDIKRNCVPLTVWKERRERERVILSLRSLNGVIMSIGIVQIIIYKTR